MITMNKIEIRREVLRRRDALSPEERKRGSMLLTERILGHQWFYLSENILMFVSYGSEIDTGEILREAWKLGKKVYVPKVCGDSMDFYRIGSMDELQSGYKGISEPEGNSERFVCRKENVSKTLMLMPGAAFDGMRNRIGYGKGFYDRYLADNEALQTRTIAIGFCCQVVEEIPAEETDIRPYQVICV